LKQKKKGGSKVKSSSDSIREEEEYDNSDAASIRTLEYTGGTNPLQWKCEEKHPDTYINESAKRRSATTTGHNTFAFPKIEVHPPQSPNNPSNLTTALNNSFFVSPQIQQELDRWSHLPTFETGLPFTPRFLETFPEAAESTIGPAIGPSPMTINHAQFGRFERDPPPPVSKETELLMQVVRSPELLSNPLFAGLAERHERLRALQLRNLSIERPTQTLKCVPGEEAGLPSGYEEMLRKSPLLNSNPFEKVPLTKSQDAFGETLGYAEGYGVDTLEGYEEMMKDSPMMGSNPLFQSMEYGYQEPPTIAAYHDAMREISEERRGRSLFRRGEEMDERAANVGLPAPLIPIDHFTKKVDESSPERPLRKRSPGAIARAMQRLENGIDAEKEEEKKQFKLRMECYKMVYERVSSFPFSFLVF
jgi:hypothetical protein